MALSKREKYIAIGTGAAVAVLAVNYAVITPYFTALNDITDKYNAKLSEQSSDNDLFDRRRHLQPVWSDLIHGGLSADASAAESQTYNALSTWAKSAGVEIDSLVRDRSTVEKEFVVTGFRFTGTGRTPAVGHLLSDIETANIPVRLTDVHVAPKKEGTDELTIQLSISTLTLRPPANAAPKPPANATASVDANNAEDRS